MLNWIAVNFEWQFRAACGYAELGMNRESVGELNAIDLEMQNRPEVLQLRLHHLMHEKRWAQALASQPETLPRCARLQRRIPACRILFA